MPKSSVFIATPWWKCTLSFIVQLVLFAVLFVLFTLGLSLLVNVFFPNSSGLESEQTLNAELFLSWISILIAAIGAIFALDFWQQKKGMAAYGFGPKKAGKSLLMGALVGITILFISFLILLAGQWAAVTAINFQGKLFFGWALFFLIQPLAEEVLMRSFLQTQLHRHFGTYAGLFMTALVFTLLHSSNENITLLASFQIFTGGLLMGLLYLKTQNIWATYAMHASWNFMQSTVLGFAVSGMDTYSLFTTETNGPNWLTGGDFGLEGSLLTLIFILLTISYFWKATKNAFPLSELEEA